MMFVVYYHLKFKRDKNKVKEKLEIDRRVLIGVTRKSSLKRFLVNFVEDCFKHPHNWEGIQADLILDKVKDIKTCLGSEREES